MLSTLIMDFDQAIYACGFAAEGEPLSHALQLIKHAIKKRIEATRVDSHEIYIEGEGNFRDSIAFTEPYKGSRPARKPKHFNDIRKYLIETKGAKQTEGAETDDVVSMLLYKDFIKAEGDKDKCTVLLSSPDKDLNNTPGWHHNPRTDEVKWISDSQAMRHFYFQLLTGDSTDNIPGLPDLAPIQKHLYSIKHKGVGKVTAKKILKSAAGLADPEGVVYQCYKDWGNSVGMSETQTRDYLEEQGRLLWMARDGKYTVVDSTVKILPDMWQINEELFNG